MNPRTLLAIPLTLVLSILGACSGGGSGGGGGGDAGGGTGGNPSPQLNFISWIGSANGENVVDGYGQFFKFRADTLQLWYGGITFVNVRVTNNGAARLIWNNSDIGCVCGVQSTNGSTISALVSNAGTFIGVFQQNGQVFWTDTQIHPVASAMASGDPEIIAEGRAHGSEDAPIDEFMSLHGFLIAAPAPMTDPTVRGMAVEAVPPADEGDWRERGTALLLSAQEVPNEDEDAVDIDDFELPTAVIFPEDFVGAPLYDGSADEAIEESSPARGW